LLERIRSERETLSRTGKIKRGKGNSVIVQCGDSSYYGKLPEGWGITTIEMLSQFVTKGTTPRGGKGTYQNKGIGFLRVENIGRNRELLLGNLKYIDEKTHKEILKRSILEENDLLISIAGALGRTAIVTKEILPLNTNQAVSFVRWLDTAKSLVKYIELAINSKEIQDSLLKQAKVTAIPNLTLEIINNCILPIPPFAEQQRIVTATKLAFEQFDHITAMFA
jgi:type I restriction enzyme S subunit